MNGTLLSFAALLASVASFPAMAQAQVNAPDTGPVGGVFVEQVGSGNDASLTQSGSAQNIDVTQTSDGDHFAGIDQTGSANIATVSQAGDPQSVAIISQTGSANTALLSQNDNGLIGSSAGIAQIGNGNLATLLQDGSDNQAILAQNGNNNTMTATQLGDGNSLEWTQTGNGLPDMAIVQSGGATAIVTQGN